MSEGDVRDWVWSFERGQTNMHEEYFQLRVFSL